MNENELTLNEINESRKHKLKVWLATLGVALFSGLVAVGVFTTQSYKKSNAYSFDDSNYSITLTENELNNYIFSNLYDSIYDTGYDWVDTYVIYDGYTFTSYTSDNNGCQYEYNDFYITCVAFDDTAFFHLQHDGNDLQFESTIQWVVYDEIYEVIKPAIQQDIEENQPLVLSAYDLNNKSYGYLVSQFITLQPESDMGYLLYDGNKYVLDDLDFNTDGYISFYNETINAGISLNFSTGKWVGTSTDYVFVHDLYIYNNFIKENIYAPMDTNGFISILDTIVSILTGGIVGFSTGVGAGVSTLVSDIFVANNALSVMGAMIVIFAGISLAIGLSRWIMNFLTSLGAKK